MSLRAGITPLLSSWEGKVAHWCPAVPEQPGRVARTRCVLAGAWPLGSASLKCWGPHTLTRLARRPLSPRSESAEPLPSGRPDPTLCGPPRLTPVSTQWRLSGRRGRDNLKGQSPGCHRGQGVGEAADRAGVGCAGRKLGARAQGRPPAGATCSRGRPCSQGTVAGRGGEVGMATGTREGASSLHRQGGSLSTRSALTRVMGLGHTSCGGKAM